MKKLLSIIATVVFFGTVIFNGQSCLAQDPLVQFVSTGGVVEDGYLNASNTGFEISGTIPGSPDFDHAKLFIGGVEQIQQPPLTEGGYSIKRTDIPLDDLKAAFPERDNQIMVGVYDSVGNIIDSESIDITADYTLNDPTLIGVNTTSADTTAGYLKVGDSIEYTLTSDEELAFISQFNGRELVWSKVAGSKFIYKSTYQVLEGDDDQEPSYEVDISYQDIAGNVGQETKALTKQIDANTPLVSIKSITDGQIFNTKIVRVDFVANEEVGPAYEIYLDNALQTIKNGGSLRNLTDGDHKLEIIVTDLAGNQSEVSVDFTIDTTKPTAELTNELSSSYNQDDKITLEGNTEPGSQVVVEVHSDVKYYQTTADAWGNWRIQIDTADLESGSHEIYLEITDLAGNATRTLLGSFEIVVPVVEQPQVEGEPIKLARAQSVSYVSDVGPVIYKPIKVEEESEVAFNPKIISSSNDREMGINWSAWLILIGLVAVSFLVAGVSYYGYSQAVTIVARQKAGRDDAEQMENEYLPKEEPVKPSIIEQDEQESPDPINNEPDAQSGIVEEDDEDIEVRW